jgi:hypothetical protein
MNEDTADNKLSSAPFRNYMHGLFLTEAGSAHFAAVLIDANLFAVHVVSIQFVSALFVIVGCGSSILIFVIGHAFSISCVVVFSQRPPQTTSTSLASYTPNCRLSSTVVSAPRCGSSGTSSASV